MFRILRLAGSALILIVAAPLLATSASGQAGVTLGTLRCNVSSGWGLVVGSSKYLDCTFSSPNGDETYAGSISKFGVDIGYTRGGVIIWTVVAPTGALGPGSLAGTYLGGTASATVGVGIGANALLGGSTNSIALQPLSIEGNQGLNVAAGIGAVTLTWRR
jgi:hypothetical protein